MSDLQLSWFRKPEPESPELATSENKIEEAPSVVDDQSSSYVAPSTVTQQQGQDEAGCIDGSPNTNGLHNKLNIFQRAALRMARYPRTHFWVAFTLALGLSIFAFIAGDFSVAADNDGWRSRGTLIANRRQQAMLVYYNQHNLFGENNEAVWTDLEETVQPNWEEGSDGDQRRRRRLRLETNIDAVVEARRPPSIMQSSVFQILLHRHLEETTNRSIAEEEMKSTPSFSQCDTTWYTDGRMVSESHLWPVWKVKKDEYPSALDPQVLEDLCVSEAHSQQILMENGLCHGCPGSSDQCLPPYSLILFLRLLIGEDAMDIDCSTLVERYTQLNLKPVLEASFEDCVTALKEANNVTVMPPQCPDGFFPSLLDEFFMESNNNVQYTSSVFVTPSDNVTIEALYDVVDEYDKGTDLIEGAYDTQNEDFVELLTETAVSSDMMLAMGSAVITAFAMLIHTKSFFLTLVGVLQVILSFPLAFFTYRFLGQLTFFPFLNFIGVFVVFALGADVVFVAVDKWKNARKDHPHLSIEEIAIHTLPDAAEAMLLTTSTTSIAFFGTAICPVAPVKLFAIFCGLLIVWDYILDVLLVFPCLCIYDEYRDKPNCCMQMQGQGGKDHKDDDMVTEKAIEKPEEAISEENEVIRPSFIRRFFAGYYNILHSFRWPLLLSSAAALAVSAYYATKLQLPTSTEVRIFRDDHEFEKAFSWRQHLLNEALVRESGSVALTIWGVRPADTGDSNDPTSWTKLVLDDTFDPSTIEAQLYLKRFCGDLFEQEFAGKVHLDYECPFSRFEHWLENQSNSSATSDAIYHQYCDNTAGLPIDDSAVFHACLTAWAHQEGESSILSREGMVTVIFFPFTQRARYDDPNDILDAEWHLTEDWFDDYQLSAPEEANKAYFSSEDYWWYDTNTAMFNTAVGSTAIALVAAAVVILVSSRSFTMTLFSVISVAYVLASVTAMMVAAGWELGFCKCKGVVLNLWSKHRLSY